MLRGVVEARGPVALILAALTGTWGTHAYPASTRRRLPRLDRRGGAERVPTARRLRHLVIRHAVLRRVADPVFRGDRRLSPRAERPRPGAAALLVSRDPVEADARAG